MKGCTWSATVFRSVKQVRDVQSISQNVVQSITLSPPACFLNIVHPGAITCNLLWLLHLFESLWISMTKMGLKGNLSHVLDVVSHLNLLMEIVWVYVSKWYLIQKVV